MGKKAIKYGAVEFDKSELADENVSIRISMMLPISIYKELKRLSLNEKHGGQYQILAKELLQKGIDSMNGANGQSLMKTARTTRPKLNAKLETAVGKNKTLAKKKRA